MTDITLVLARYIGIYFVVAGIAVVARRDTIGQFVQRYREDNVLTFIAGVLALWFGLVVLALHWQWDDALAAAITFIGLLAAIKGTVLLVFGGKATVLARPFDENLHVAAVWGVVIALIGTFLVWASFAA
ncbi:hypothetical protein E5163_14480 [Marinicauda algicola]|uniref:Uncharacterized protein n=1 Tax=Marinicauda algicola TaxID=2029849 RepID=A0A4S2GX18_9PROT|nr:hypothetical protein [Marinicauda algicola]TGY87637.1 hypothetical protein E5163_14480 [Marinicauda algicola]